MVQPTPAPAKKSKGPTVIIIVIIVLVVLCCCSGILGSLLYYCGDLLSGGSCGF
jgi:flagellar basal body-associated protein FliL